MKIDIEQMAPCVRRLTIEIPAESVDRELVTIYKNLQKRVKLPGFRPGKVPLRILEQQYRHVVEQEVLQKLVPGALSEALTQENLRAVGEPQIDQMHLVRGQPLQFVSTVQIVPEFEVSDYHAWEFERRIPEVSEVQIDEALEQLRERHAALQTVDGRPVREGDVAIVNYQGFLHGQPVPGMEQKGVVVEVGGGRFLPELEQGLIGMAEGQAQAIMLHFSEDHHDETLAGRAVECRVQVTEIKEKILPELDDEFAREYEDAESLAALRERVRDDLERAARRQADDVLRSEILARFVAENPIEIPERLVQDQMRHMFARRVRQETGREVTEAELQIDPDELREVFGEPALEAVRGQLILQHLGEVAEIAVEPAAVEAEVAALAERTAQNPEALKQAMDRNGTLSALEAGLRERKIFDALMAEMHIIDKTVSAEDTASTAAAEQ
jgi:trigger factor